MKRSPGRSSPRTRRSCSAADSPSSSSTIRSPRSSPTCGRRPAQSDRGDGAQPGARLHRHRPVRGRAGLCRRPAGAGDRQGGGRRGAAAPAIGRSSSAPSMCSTSRPMRWRRSPRPGRRSAISRRLPGRRRFHPGRSGTLQLGPKIQLGWFGEIHPRVLQAMDVRGPLYGFEIVLNALPEPRGRTALRPALEASDPHAGQARFRLRGR